MPLPNGSCFKRLFQFSGIQTDSIGAPQLAPQNVMTLYPEEGPWGTGELQIGRQFEGRDLVAHSLNNSLYLVCVNQVAAKHKTWQQVFCSGLELQLLISVINYPDNISLLMQNLSADALSYCYCKMLNDKIPLQLLHAHLYLQRWGCTDGGSVARLHPAKKQKKINIFSGKAFFIKHFIENKVD